MYQLVASGVFRAGVLVVGIVILKWDRIKPALCRAGSWVQSQYATPPPVIAPLEPDPATVPGLYLYRMISAAIERAMREKRPDVARGLVGPLMTVVPGTDFGPKECLESFHVE